MPDKNKKALAAYRLKTASECLVTAGNNMAASDYKAAANRSYYCIFSAIRAVLALDGFDSKKHSGIISEFRRGYIKTGAFPIEFSDMIKEAFNARGKSDYDDFFVISKTEVMEQIENARVFLAAVEEYLSDK